MEAPYAYLNSLLNSNKTEFNRHADINWFEPYRLYSDIEKRDLLIENLKDSTLFNETKPFYKQISKGCSICGSGKWSCLFLTNKCNAACFYCPTAQDNDEMPATQSIDFSTPQHYADYINKFGFTGVSFSGGEPLLYFERTLAYLKAIRKTCDNTIYCWLYTNGILATQEKIKILAENGLNEIRFDIGATGYSLDKVKLAIGIIPVVSIEIPAVPHEKETLITLLPKMAELGVNNLNLHQLRLTHHNAQNFIDRGYSIIAAERPIVFESELTALEIIESAKVQNIDIGINYCSFHYKNRFQKAGYRQIITQKIFPEIILTQNGYIREYNGDTLIYKTIKFSAYKNELVGLKLELNGTCYNYSVLTLFKELIPFHLKEAIDKIVNHESHLIPNDSFLFTIWQYENIEKGLREL